LKHDLAWRVDSGPGRPETGTGTGWRKNKRGKTQCDLVDSTRPGQKPDCNLLTFVFYFTKTTSFWFKKKKNWPGRLDDPVKTRNPSLKLKQPPGRVWKLWEKHIRYLFCLKRVYIFLLLLILDTQQLI